MSTISVWVQLGAGPPENPKGSGPPIWEVKITSEEYTANDLREYIVSHSTFFQGVWSGDLAVFCGWDREKSKLMDRINIKDRIIDYVNKGYGTTDTTPLIVMM